MHNELITRIASSEILDQAYVWLCERRKDYPHNDDVWDVRWRWTTMKPALQAVLLAGQYRFSPLRRVEGKTDTFDIWHALDSLVLKAMAIVLQKHLAPHLSDRCFHLAGRGGAKAAVRAVAEKIGENTFVFRTDVKSFYASIDHQVLLDRLTRVIGDRRVLALLRGYLERVICDGGTYELVERGISLGCPLSPLMGAVYLSELDRAMERLGLFYARFMDDWVILSPSRWKLRQAIRLVNQELAELKVRQHPDKTFIGRIERGFDFLGYQFGPSGLGIARPTVERFVERARRLYEQGADRLRIDEYVRRWWKWVTAGIGSMIRDERMTIVCDGEPLALPVPGTETCLSSSLTVARELVINKVVHTALQRYWKSQLHTL
jgi:hypothetical protein